MTDIWQHHNHWLCLYRDDYLGPVDKLDSQINRDVIQDTFWGRHLVSFAYGRRRMDVFLTPLSHRFAGTANDLPEITDVYWTEYSG